MIQDWKPLSHNQLNLRRRKTRSRAPVKMTKAQQLHLHLLAFQMIAVLSSYEEPPYFQHYEDQLGASYMKRCQMRLDPPNGGDSCRRQPKACMWGDQTCLGTVRLQPTARCNCYEGSWACQPFLCPTIEPKCPSADPSTVTPASVCSTDLACGYEEQTCCGKTVAKK